MKIGEIKARAIRGRIDNRMYARKFGPAQKIGPTMHLVTFLLESGGEIEIGVSSAMYAVIMENLGESFTLTVSG